MPPKKGAAKPAKGGKNEESKDDKGKKLIINKSTPNFLL